MKRSTSGVRRSKVKVVRAEHRYGGVVEASFSTISGLVGILSVSPTADLDTE